MKYFDIRGYISFNSDNFKKNFKTNLRIKTLK